MRSIKELLEVMLSNQHHFSRGLCSWIEKLYFNSLISLQEKNLLHEYVFKHKPIKYRIHTFLGGKDGYFWKKEEKEPRIKWIQKHIKKTNK